MEDKKTHIKGKEVRRVAIVGKGMIENRRFAGELGRKLWLFDRLIWSVISYGVEIWRWKEKEKIEKLLDRYLK